MNIPSYTGRPVREPARLPFEPHDVEPVDGIRVHYLDGQSTCCPTRACCPFAAIADPGRRPYAAFG
ncbi:hypothetical protein [Nonomuraea dietziae]|uniref:hypothetical protein n=1 Tax=Nonomuraea dietziae TaxID=65515 RepID=UPI0033CA7138